MIDPNQHDRFVVTRQRRFTIEPSVGNVDVYDFALADATVDAPTVCHVRQRVARFTERITFYADPARTVALMHLNPRLQFDPWARYDLTDARLDTIGEIQKVFVARRRRSHYVLFGADGNEVARVEADVPAAVARRRAAGVAVAAGAGALGLPFIGVAGAAVVALAVRAGLRHVGSWVDPVDVTPELRIVRGDRTLGVVLRRPQAPTGPMPLPLPWQSSPRVFEIDMRADAARTVDRRLVLAVPVALDALHGVFAGSK